MWSKAPRPWHHILDVVPFFAGMAIFHRAPVNDWDVVFVGGGLIAIGVGSFWSTDMGMVADKRNDRKVEDDGFEDIDARQEERDRAARELAALSGLTPMPKVNLFQTAEVEYNYQTVSANLIQKDLRWKQFGEDVVVHRTPMTQAKWTGKGRPFSKREFSAKMNEWLADGIVKYKNPKNHNDGFTPNGGAGRAYFCGLARGDEWIPLPHSD